MSRVVTYPVFFRSHRDGSWKLQHEFVGRASAIECARNNAIYATFVVNEVVREGGKLVSERQIHEEPLRAAKVA